MNRPPTGPGGSHLAGRTLVGTRLSVLAAELSDPDRFRRGRAYARQHAVIELEIHPGRLTGSVRGSRPQPYAVRWSVALWTKGQPVMPRRADVSASCTCPDGVGVCKHAVAVLLEFADAVGRDPDRLLEWRAADPDAPITAGQWGGDDGDGIGEEAAPPSPLDDFFGVRERRGARAAGDDSPLPVLERAPRPASATELEHLAWAALDSALTMLESLYG